MKRQDLLNPLFLPHEILWHLEAGTSFHLGLLKSVNLDDEVYNKNAIF